MLLEEHMLPLPELVDYKHDFGMLLVKFDDHDRHGRHCVIEGPGDAIVEWLMPFDGIAIGNGSPQMESFTIKHVKRELARQKGKR